MGNKFEVHSYVKDNTGDYEFTLSWRGESFIQALLAMRREKKKGVGCVRLEWRGL